MLSSAAYRSYKCTRNTSAYKYLDYGFKISAVYFPKLSYQNNFEEEYTKKSVKYNYIVVLGLSASTLYATKSKINSYYQ